MDYLVDTNVLLRALAVRNPLHPVTRQAIKILLEGGGGLCVAPQNLVELWNVCTRTEKYNGPVGDAVALPLRARICSAGVPTRAGGIATSAFSPPTPSSPEGRR